MGKGNVGIHFPGALRGALHRGNDVRKPRLERDDLRVFHGIEVDHVEPEVEAPPCMRHPSSLLR